MSYTFKKNSFERRKHAFCTCMSAEKQKNHPAERIYPAEYNARNDKENSSAGKK